MGLAPDQEQGGLVVGRLLAPIGTELEVVVDEGGRGVAVQLRHDLIGEYRIHGVVFDELPEVLGQSPGGIPARGEGGRRPLRDVGQAVRLHVAQLGFVGGIVQADQEQVAGQRAVQPGAVGGDRRVGVLLDDSPRPVERGEVGLGGGRLRSRGLLDGLVALGEAGQRVFFFLLAATGGQQKDHEGGQYQSFSQGTHVHNGVKG
ncbi:MAG: hypothetical protein NTW26_05980 [bacterium]|nr:hypothetical protein [bacterium]